LIVPYARRLHPIGPNVIPQPYDRRTPEEIKLPFYGNMSFSAADPRVPGILVNVSSWVKASRIYRYDPATQQLADTGLQPL
jgi:hypothetical protein